MSLPIVEQITRNVADTLSSVRVVNGYQTDLIVQRPSRLGNPPRDNLAVLYQESPNRDNASAAQGHIAWRQAYNVTCYVIESESSTRALDERINLVRSDIEKAVLVDATRGGLAVDTILIDPQVFDYIDGEFSGSGVDVRFEVLYRTLESDPYTQ